MDGKDNGSEKELESKENNLTVSKSNCESSTPENEETRLPEKVILESEEAIKVANANSLTLSGSEYYLQLNLDSDGEPLLKCSYFPKNAFIDPDLHGDVILIPPKKFGLDIYGDERDRLVSEMVEYSDLTYEEASKHLKENKGLLLEEFFKKPDTIQIGKERVEVEVEYR